LRKPAQSLAARHGYRKKVDESREQVGRDCRIVSALSRLQYAPALLFDPTLTIRDMVIHLFYEQ
jgi:hypothetical protein